MGAGCTSWVSERSVSIWCSQIWTGIWQFWQNIIQSFLYVFQFSETWELKELRQCVCFPHGNTWKKCPLKRLQVQSGRVGQAAATACGRMWVQAQFGLTSNSPVWVTFWDLVSNTITTTETEKKNNKNKNPKPKFVSESPPTLSGLCMFSDSLVNRVSGRTDQLSSD